MSVENKAVVDIVKANADALYKDAAQPSVRVVGKAIAQCVSLFTEPVGRMAEIFKKNINRYIDKLEGYKEEDLTPPDTRILVPILEKMRFTEEEKVADYYAEILAAASKKETRGKVLLSFIEILNRITSDEIKMLEFINSNKNIICIKGDKLTEEERAKYFIPNKEIKVPFPGVIPIIDVQINTQGQEGYVLALNNFNTLTESIDFDFPENIDLYIENLISLGLIHIPYGKSFASKPVYQYLKEHKMIKEIEAKLKDKEEISFNESRIDLTNLSLKLLAICSKK